MPDSLGDIVMALGIMIAGLLSAVFGTLLAIAMGLDLGLAPIVYGLFGICGGVMACIAGMPVLRNLGRTRGDRNRGIS